MVAAQYRPGDLVWVHDYQLLLLPGLLRRRLPDARIGFFLHIPFPVGGAVPDPARRRRSCSRGCSAPTWSAFTPPPTSATSPTVAHRHPGPHRRHRPGPASRPRGAARRLPDGRSTRASFRDAGPRPRGARPRRRRCRGDGSVRILVGVDRLDYTKGIPRRLLAYERMLETHPELREQGAAGPGGGALPHRGRGVPGLPARWWTAWSAGSTAPSARRGWVPVHYIFRALSPRDLVALYRAADVMLVTPLRDGMNLVAKEFVASRIDGDGVLVLSEFAGAVVGAARGAPGQPVRHRWHGRRVLPRADDGAGGAPGAPRAAARRGWRRSTCTAGSRSFLEQLADVPPDRRARAGADRRPRPRGTAGAGRAGWTRPTRSCCCSTTTAPWCRSPRLPSWPAPTPRSCALLRSSPAGPTPRCTS